MEAHSLLLFGSSSNPPITSLQNPKKPFLSTLPTSFSPSPSSKNRFFIRISYKTNNSIDHSQIILSNKPLQCESSVEGADIHTDLAKGLTKRIRRKNLAVFVSGGGSNFRAIHDAIVKGSIQGDVVVLVASKRDCGGAEYARHKEIPVILFPKTKGDAEGLSASDLVTALRRYNVDSILLAGYLKLIPAELIRAYPKSVLNIHPSLLPAFGGKGYYGMKVHKAVIASGARYSGPTIHFVDENYDTGRILAQRVVPVLANDTPEELAARVLSKEHQLYVEVVTALCEERIIWREDGVPLIQNKENSDCYS